MEQRNMVYTGSILEPEHGRVHSEPPSIVPYGGMLSFPQPSGSRTSFNPAHLPENHGSLPPGVTQYNGHDHPHHHHANNVFMTPIGARVFPAAINHGIQDGHFMDVFKRKNSIHYFYPTPGSSSSVGVPMNTDGAMMDGPSLVMEPAVHRSGRNMGSGAIGVDPVLAHGSSHLVPGNYGGQPLVPNPWLDQQWNPGPSMPYLQGPINAGGLIPGAFMHPPTVTPHHGPHNIHHHPAPPPPPMPPMQGPNIDFHSQVARRLPTNTGVNPFQNGIDLPLPMFVGPAQPTGIRVFRPHRREHMVEVTARHRVFPHLRILPEDGVAILDISGYHEAGHSVDHHRDMRLDIDHMSYEELLALGEQIGSAGSGLSDDFIQQRLKTRVYASSKSSSAEQELNSCVICQTNYDDQEEIGLLDCGHEYHVDCVKKWLAVKNSCPVCKSTALGVKSKGN